MSILSNATTQIPNSVIATNAVDQISKAVAGGNSLKSIAQRELSELSYDFFTPGTTRKKTKNGEFSPDAFRASLTNGIASPALFLFKFSTLPKFMTKGGKDNILQTLQMRVRRAQIPDMSLQTNQFSYYGVPSKLPYENSTTDLNLEIICSSNLWEREFFSIWQNYIIDYGMMSSSKSKGPTFDVAYYDDYVTEATLEIYNEEGGDPTTIFTFEGVYPKTLSSIDVDWSAKDTIMYFSLEASYSYWGVSKSTAGIEEVSTNKKSSIESLLDSINTKGIDTTRKFINNFIF
jgi:hypothetical protein